MVEEAAMKTISVEIGDDLYDYLDFLEKMKFIRNKEEAVAKALRFFQRLAMHNWLPHIYRIEDDRVILLERGMFLDIFETMTEEEIYNVGRISALKRKVMKPDLRDVDLTKPTNWGIVLKELQNLGWGTFTRTRNEIKVEYCAVHTLYLRGYLETMFKVELREHRTEIPGLVVFIAGEPKMDAWR